MEWLERHRSTLATALVVLIAVAAFAVLQVPRRPALQITAPASPPSPPSIKVHVAGAVQLPGVYQLAADARVEDGLKAAGGPAPSADLSALNLAAPLKDGQQLAVPQAGTSSEAAPPSGSPQIAQSTKLDLNRASLADLDALPGIGPVTAQKLVDYRTKQGRFSSIDELKDAKLVTASTFEKVKDLVEVR
ncbi:MAG: ComEA family DNA-binding protein [Actinobacteria bacterium]|nr:ComEA family DNA-binding protein [Actinomycetota bacterium]